MHPQGQNTPVKFVSVESSRLCKGIGDIMDELLDWVIYKLNSEAFYCGDTFLLPQGEDEDCVRLTFDEVFKMREEFEKS